MKLRLASMAIGAALAVATAVPAFAAPGDHGKGNGGCVDTLYGNATNPRPDGHGVIPSQSPGPWVNSPSDPDNPTMGNSVGDWIQIVRNLVPGANGGDVVPLFCTFP